MKIILIVDDQTQIRELLKATLELEYEVILATTGLEALRLAQMVGPNLIILDLYLGNSLMTGLQTLKELKSSFAHIPILLVSGVVKVDNEIVRQAMEIGADEFLEKPFSPINMLKVIEGLLNGGQNG